MLPPGPLWPALMVSPRAANTEVRKVTSPLMKQASPSTARIRPAPARSHSMNLEPQVLSRRSLGQVQPAQQGSCPQAQETGLGPTLVSGGGRLLVRAPLSSPTSAQAQDLLPRQQTYAEKIAEEYDELLDGNPWDGCEDIALDCFNEWCSDFDAKHHAPYNEDTSGAELSALGVESLGKGGESVSIGLNFGQASADEADDFIGVKRASLDTLSTTATLLFGGVPASARTSLASSWSSLKDIGRHRCGEELERTSIGGLLTARRRGPTDAVQAGPIDIGCMPTPRGNLDTPRSQGPSFPPEVASLFGTKLCGSVTPLVWRPGDDMKTSATGLSAQQILGGALRRRTGTPTKEVHSMGNPTDAHGLSVPIRAGTDECLSSRPHE